MNTRRIAFLGSLLTGAALLGVTAVPAFAASPNAPSLNDGRVHQFTGCLAQEPTGTRYFDLQNAKSDDGHSLGTVRLTSSLSGITPKSSLNEQVQVRGLYLGHNPSDPQGGHIAVEEAGVVGAKCS